MRSFKYILKKIYYFIMSLFRIVIDYPIIFNANKEEENFQKRALIIYLIKPFQIKENDPKYFNHQNLKQCKQITAVLGELGYIVDVADWKSKRIKTNREYDLLLSHNATLNISNIYLKKNSIKIYLSTGMNHKIHNRNVRSRYKNIRLRRNSELIIREQRQEFLSFVEIADSLIGFGNEFIMDSWHEDFNIKTFPFNNYGFKSTQFLTKNFTTARKNFFFLASGSQVLKGLDLLLEIFPKHPKLNLYICSSFNNEPDFIKCYYKELYRTSNIHPIGWISITSPKFLELVKQCAYVISPSCVEGQPGAVVQCMHAGLIPVVTKETGIETEDFGVTFKNDSLEELETTITRLSKLPITWHKNHSQLTRKIALEKYSEKSFINRWREILSEIKYTVEK